MTWVYDIQRIFRTRSVSPPPLPLVLLAQITCTGDPPKGTLRRRHDGSKGPSRAFVHQNITARMQLVRCLVKYYKDGRVGWLFDRRGASSASKSRSFGSSVLPRRSWSGYNRSLLSHENVSPPLTFVRDGGHEIASKYMKRSRVNCSFI